jgi:hypothetical protein
MEPPSKVIEFLPSTQAKWVLWLSLFLSGLLYALLQYLQVDTLLPLAQAQKLSMLLPSAILLLVGAYIVLFFVVKKYNFQISQHISEIAEINKKSKTKISLSNSPRFQYDRSDLEPESHPD